MTLFKIHNLVNDTNNQVSDFAGQLAAFEIKFSHTHLTLYEPKPEGTSAAFSTEKIRQLFGVYLNHVHVLYPIFDKPENICVHFQDDMSRTAERNNLVETSFENAQALLFLAIGSCFPDAEYTGGSDTRPGMIYYHSAQQILKRKFRDRSIAYAKTSTLAAIYTSQNGMLTDSLIHLHASHSIYADVVKR